MPVLGIVKQLVSFETKRKKVEYNAYITAGFPEP
jgi:hypothetical protein